MGCMLFDVVVVWMCVVGCSELVLDSVLDVVVVYVVYCVCGFEEIECVVYFCMVL